MPKLSGWQLAERLGTLRPRMKVLFMSGYVSDASASLRVQNAEVAFLQKPVTPQNLPRKVREVLGPAPVKV